MSKKVIITGATGQDGSYMAEYLLNTTDYEVLGAVRRTSQPILGNLKEALKNPRFRLVTLDLNDAHSVSALIKKEIPDYFINLGASTFVPDSWNQPALVMQTNAIALVHILEAARQFSPNCRVYSAGSSEQWGDVQSSPQDETTPMRPRSMYGVSKCAASHTCKIYRESYGMYVVHGVLLNHESERRQEYFVTRKISKGVARIYHAIKNEEKFEPIHLGNLDAFRDWSHASDFIVGIWMMLNQNKPKDYVLSNNETHSVREFVEKAFEAAGVKGTWFNNGGPTDEYYGYSLNGTTVPLVVVDPKFYRPAEVELLHGSSNRIRYELGWEPKISFEELVTRMVHNDIANP